MFLIILIFLINITFNIAIDEQILCKTEKNEDITDCRNQYERYEYFLNRSNIESDIRKLILTRLNLAKEPNIKLTKDHLKFIQLQKEIAKNFHNLNADKRDIYKTKYDKANNQPKIVKTLYEAVGISNCNVAQINLTCLTFKIPAGSLYSNSEEEIFNHDGQISSKLFKKYSSISLWIYAKVSSNRDKIKAIRIRNLETHKKIYFKNINDGWNTINLANLLEDDNLNNINLLNTSFTYRFAMKCLKDCSIFSIKMQNDDIKLNENEIYISSLENKKPLLSISQQDEKQIDLKTRYKRDKNNRFNEFDLYEKEQVRRCEDNLPNPNKECCLVTHVVTFSQLKWSPWIISPASFPANYCIGRCTTKNYVKSSYNADIKYQFNTLVLNDKINKEMISSCCHPISMSSIKIKYIRMNENTGQMETVMQNLPNMVVDNCGCS